MKTIEAGTRSSKLALAQVQIVRLLLDGRARVNDHSIVTSGDRHGTQAQGDGLFVKEIQRALLDEQIDCAVHSFKDLPTQSADGLVIAAVLEREDPRDAMIGVSPEALSAQSRVGTGSPRRAAQLRNLALDVDVVPIRGNVPTRLRKLDAGEVDAIVLALAGLKRLGIERAMHVFAPQQMTPAPGQGAIAIEVRSDDGVMRELLATLDHAPSRIAAEAERAVLRALGGGCMLPLGAHCEVQDGLIRLFARIVSEDGKHVVEAAGRGDDPQRVVDEVVQALIAGNGPELLNR